MLLFGKLRIVKQEFSLELAIKVPHLDALFSAPRHLTQHLRPIKFVSSKKKKNRKIENTICFEVFQYKWCELLSKQPGLL